MQSSKQIATMYFVVVEESQQEEPKLSACAHQQKLEALRCDTGCARLIARRAYGELGDRLALGTASPSPERGGGRRRLGRSGLLFRAREQLHQCTLQKRISNEFNQFQFKCFLLYCMSIQSVRVRCEHLYKVRVYAVDEAFGERHVDNARLQ